MSGTNEGERSSLTALYGGTQHPSAIPLQTVTVNKLVYSRRRAAALQLQ